MSVTYYQQSPVGMLGFVVLDDTISQLTFSESIEKVEQHSPAPLNIAAQLERYFNCLDDNLNLPYRLHGTAFQRKVWNTLLDIPFGKTCTYSELAKQLSSHPRAVGQACKKNPLPLIIPCHRVIGKTSLGGFLGKDHTGIKAQLLKREYGQELVSCPQ